MIENDRKEELLSILRDIILSDFFTKKEKDEVLLLITKGNKKMAELIELLRKYLVAKVVTRIKNK